MTAQERITSGASGHPRNTRDVMLTVRVTQAGSDAITLAAMEAGVPRAAMIRAMLGYATDHLPDVQRRLRTR